MGMIDVLREVVTLTENVKRLQTDFDTLLERVNENRERIVKLQALDDVINAKMAQQAAEIVGDCTRYIESRLADVKPSDVKRIRSKDVGRRSLPDK